MLDILTNTLKAAVAVAVSPVDMLAAMKPAAWRHTMDNTEGIKSNKPWVVLTGTKKNPYGKPGVDYSLSYPVVSEALYTATQLKAAYAAGLKEALNQFTFGRSMGEIKDAIRAQIPKEGI